MYYTTNKDVKLSDISSESREAGKRYLYMLGK